MQRRCHAQGQPVRDDPPHQVDLSDPFSQLSSGLWSLWAAALSSRSPRVVGQSALLWAGDLRAACQPLFGWRVARQLSTANSEATGLVHIPAVSTALLFEAVARQLRFGGSPTGEGSISVDTLGHDRQSDKQDSAAREETLRALLRAEVEAKVGALDAFEDLERTVLQVCNELSRDLLEETLQQMARGYLDQLRIRTASSANDEETTACYKRHRAGRATYHSLCGPLHIERDTYRLTGVHNGPTVVPLELEAALMHGMTPAMASSALCGYAEGPSRGYLRLQERSFRYAPPRATFERRVKALAKQALGATATIEPIVRQQEPVDPAVRAISIGLDRTAVPMATPRALSSSEIARSGRPRLRRAPSRVDIDWRMDYVGTVSLVDANAEAVKTWRYRAAADDGPDEIVARMIADVKHTRRRRYRCDNVVVQDGAPELWNVLRTRLRQANVGSWHEVVDLYHARQRLAECIDIIGTSFEQKQRLKMRWLAALKEQPGAIKTIVASVRRRIRPLRGQKRALARSHLNYFLKRIPLMDYAAMRARNLPVGSGVTEGACKSLIAARAKRNGQRWGQPGLSGVLNLRALAQSDRMDRFWPLFTRPYRATEIASVA